MSSSVIRPPVRRRALIVAAGVLVGAGAVVVLPQALDARADVANGAWYTMTARHSGRCVDAAGASAASGTAVQQYPCNGSDAQRWRFEATDSGYVRIVTKVDASAGIDVKGPSTADATPVHLWSSGTWASQQWRPVPESGNLYHLVNRHSGECLDVPSASLAASVQLQQYPCNGSNAQTFALAVAGASVTNPDLGSNVKIFDPSMSAASVQSALDAVFATQETNQFGSARSALLFRPGSYAVDANVGFYTQVAGLGLSPDDVTIDGAVHAEADWFAGNATQNFWRGVENLSVTPAGGSDRWAVSQAAPYRRVHLRGNLALDDGGWSSGGLIADSKIDGTVASGSQQQWLTRDSEIGGWTGSNWNMVFAGVQGAPAQSFPSPPDTTVATTPVTREKPFLYVDDTGAFRVFVPSVRENGTGTSWSSGAAAGTSRPLSDFYIVKDGDTAASINAALASGLDLLVTPGVYHLSAALQVTRADTVVLGLGLATFVPDGGVTAMSVADVDGVNIAGVLFDAGTTSSAHLLQIGPGGSSADHADDPTSLHDVYFRVGGAAVGRAAVSLEINSDDVIGDHTWVWRADHGTGVGWTTNTAERGVTVNGDDVTFYGLFVEHFQGYQVYWKGERGRTYFFQNELPYDVPSNADCWAAYKVDDAVTTHEAWGLGSYAYFTANPSVIIDHPFEVPQRSGVVLHDLTTVVLGGQGNMAHIVNSTGDGVSSSHTVSTLTQYP